MCIIIGIPTSKPLPSDEILTHCWEQNPDWGGFAFVNDKGRIVINKFNKCEDLIAGLKTAKKQFRTPIIVHMRWATHGAVSYDNTHPFRISDSLVFAHNGTVRPCTADATKEKSDTRVFRDKILKQIGAGELDFRKNKGLVPLLKKYIGHSKLAFLNTKKELWLINEDKGEWVDGVWFSNDYYKTERVVKEAWHKFKCIRCGDSSYAVLPKTLVISEERTKSVQVQCCYSCRTDIAEMFDIKWAKNIWDCDFCDTKEYQARSEGKEFYRILELNRKQAAGCCETCFNVLYKDGLTLRQLKTKGNSNSHKFNKKLRAALSMK